MHWDNQTGRRLQARTGILLLLLLAGGCGSKGDVSGKVLYEDQPLTRGAVVFHTGGRVALTSVIKEDGSYALHSVPAGPVKITVTVPVGNANTRMPGAKEEIPVNADALTQEQIDKLPLSMREKFRPPTGPVRPIPKQYTDSEQTPLEYTVVGGAQTHDIKFP
jgi:hypothetical protein